MQDALKFIADNHLGDVASILGLLVAMVGFSLTVLAALRSKTAAEQARAAAEQARSRIAGVDSMADLSAALASMEEIRRLHRHKAWQILPDRYSQLRRALISIRGSFPGLTEEQSVLLQGAIQHFANIERQVDQALMTEKEPPDAHRLNRIVSRQADLLAELLIALRNSLT